MLKKLCGIFLVLMIDISVQLPKAEAGYNQYYKGDKNYPLLYGHMGISKYLDKSAAVVLQDDKKCSKFAVNIITVDENRDISSVDTFWYLHNRADETSIAYNSLDGQNWRQFRTGDSVGFMQVTVNGYKAGHYAAFGYGWF